MISTSVKDLRLPYNACKEMTIKEIRNTKEYASLTPLGQKNVTGKYRFGNKSYLNKEKLCQALDNPVAYQKKIKELKKKSVNAGPRKRSTREGNCPVHRDMKVCPPSHANKGLTTTGKPCCYKKQQSEKVVRKRMAVKKYISKKKAISKNKVSKKKTSTKKKSTKKTGSKK